MQGDGSPMLLWWGSYIISAYNQNIQSSWFYPVSIFLVLLLAFVANCCDSFAILLLYHFECLAKRQQQKQKTEGKQCQKQYNTPPPRAPKIERASTSSPKRANWLDQWRTLKHNLFSLVKIPLPYQRKNSTQSSFRTPGHTDKNTTESKYLVQKVSHLLWQSQFTFHCSQQPHWGW